MRHRLRRARSWTKLERRRARTLQKVFIRRFVSHGPILERSFIPFYDGLFPEELFVEPSELDGETFSE